MRFDWRMRGYEAHKSRSCRVRRNIVRSPARQRNRGIPLVHHPRRTSLLALQPTGAGAGADRRAPFLWDERVEEKVSVPTPTSSDVSKRSCDQKVTISFLSS